MNPEVMCASAFWRRLDTIGSDAARLYQRPDGWRLSGTAVFLQEKQPAKLDYDLHFHADWTTARGLVQGFVGPTAVDKTFQRDTSGWSIDGVAVPGLGHLQDLDFGFTPATNFAQLRRANLAVDQAIDFAVAWWEPGTPTLVDLPQHYRRRSERAYWYQSPSGPYEAELELAPSGFVRHYPQLWVLESD